MTNCKISQVVGPTSENCSLSSACAYHLNNTAGIMSLTLDAESNESINLNMCSSTTVESFIDFKTHVEYNVVNNGKGKVVDNDIIDLLTANGKYNDIFDCEFETVMFELLSELFGSRGSLSAIYVDSLPFPTSAVRNVIDQTTLSTNQKEVFELILIKLLSKMGNLRDALSVVILSKSERHHSSIKTDLAQIFETSNSVSFYTAIIQGINAMQFDRVETALSIANALAAIVLKAGRDHRDIDHLQVSTIISDTIVSSLLVDSQAYAPKSIAIQNFLLSAKVTSLTKNATLLTAALERPAGSFTATSIDSLNVADIDYCIDVFNRAISNNNYVKISPLSEIIKKYSIFDIPNTVCDVNSKLIIGNFYTQNSVLAHYADAASCNVLFTESRVIDKFLSSMIDTMAGVYSEQAIKGLLSVLSTLETGKEVGDSNVFLVNVDMADMEILAFAVHPTVRFDFTNLDTPTMFWNITDSLGKLQRTQMFEEYFTKSVGTVIAVSAKPVNNLKTSMIPLKNTSEKLNGQIADLRLVPFRDVLDVSVSGDFEYAGKEFEYDINIGQILSRCHPESTRFHISKYVRNVLATYESIKSIPRSMATCQDDDKLEESYVLTRDIVINGFEKSYSEMILEKILSTSQGKYMYENVNTIVTELVYSEVKMNAIESLSFKTAIADAGVAKTIVLDIYKALLA